MGGIEGVINRQAVIGMEEDGLNISYKTFVNLLKNFPTETELWDCKFVCVNSI